MHQHCLMECIEKLYYKKYRVTSTARGWGSTSEVDTTRKVDIYKGNHFLLFEDSALASSFRRLMIAKQKSVP